MFQVKESDQMTTVKSLINDRISDLKVRYEDYKPEEMPKIESAIIEEKGNYILPEKLSLCTEVTSNICI